VFIPGDFIQCEFNDPVVFPFGRDLELFDRVLVYSPHTVEQLGMEGLADRIVVPSRLTKFTGKDNLQLYPAHLEYTIMSLGLDHTDKRLWNRYCVRMKKGDRAYL
jgi:hypothetical protein